jgi:hypothetical protein
MGYLESLAGSASQFAFETVGKRDGIDGREERRKFPSPLCGGEPTISGYLTSPISQTI